MNWIVLLIIYCIVCILSVIYIRRRNIKRGSQRFDVINWMVLILIAPLAIVLLPFWLPFILVPHLKQEKQYRKRRKEHKRWKKEFKARTIIGGKEGVRNDIESLSTYKCKNCGYTIRSMPQGFFKLSSGVYYNFKCEKCKNIISVCSKDVGSDHCPECEEHNSLSFWNPIEGHCPKCSGEMEEKTAVANN